MRFLLLVPVAISIAAFGCSGTDAAVGNVDAAASDATTDGSGGDGSSSDGNSSDGGSSDGAGRDGSNDAGSGDGAAGDSGRDAQSDGGLTSDPGHVACGTMTCTTPQEFCCVEYADAGSTRTCENSANLSACMIGVREACDEAADCANNQVCCIELGSGYGETTRCMPTCITGAIRYQACRTSAECENHQACRLVTCPGNPPMGMCEVPPGCQ